LTIDVFLFFLITSSKYLQNRAVSI